MNKTPHSNVKKYVAKVAYIGRGFSGFQSQPDLNSIQDHIEKALSVILAEPVRIRGASRTDSGVHAEAQVFSFQTAKIFEISSMIKSMNALLPKTISVFFLDEIDRNFHPIHSAVGKVYRYRIWRGNCNNPFIAPHVWEVFKGFDVALFEKELQSFVGNHDFTSFCNSDTNAKTRVREVYELEVVQTDNLLDVWVSGRGFLKQMIRIMVGTLVDISQGRIDLSVKELVATKDRRKAGRTAPAHGLSLVEVFYDEPKTLKELISESQRGFTLKI